MTRRRLLRVKALNIKAWRTFTNDISTVFTEDSKWHDPYVILLHVCTIPTSCDILFPAEPRGPYAFNCSRHYLGLTISLWWVSGSLELQQRTSCWAGGHQFHSPLLYSYNWVLKP